MTTASTASAEFVAAFLGLGQRLGFDPKEVLERSGIAPSALESPTSRIPVEHLRSVWRCAAELTHEQALGLRAAQELRFGELGAFDQRLSQVSTFGDALRELMRSSALLANAGTYSLTVLDDSIYLTHRAKGALRQLSEFTFGVTTLRARESLGRDWRPIRVGYMHSAPADSRRYREFFDGPVLFGEPFDYLSFPRETMTAPFLSGASVSPAPQPDPPAEGFAELVRMTLLQSFLENDPSIEAVAGHLCISARTLQRRLRAHGIGHREMLDELRFLVASRELDRSHNTQETIARSLCYSDHKSLNRAFRRWSSDTPSQRRRRAP